MLPSDGKYRMSDFILVPNRTNLAPVENARWFRYATGSGTACPVLKLTLPCFLHSAEQKTCNRVREKKTFRHTGLRHSLFMSSTLATSIRSKPHVSLYRVEDRFSFSSAVLHSYESQAAETTRKEIEKLNRATVSYDEIPNVSSQNVRSNHRKNNTTNKRRARMRIRC